MQNDERDELNERQQRDETPASGAADASETADVEEDEAAARDEFETASWPQHDRGELPPTEAGSQGGMTSSEEAPLPDEAPAEPSPAGPPPAEPPPPDVEAYTPATEPVPPARGGDTVPAHSVPATEPGESTRCPRCGTENRPGISFCRNCGQRLVAAGAPATVARPAPPEGTQACPRCGTHNRAGVAFCQNCGANLRAAAEGYVPPAVEPAAAASVPASEELGRAVLGPVVLLIGALGLAVGWLLPFMGGASLFDQSFGRADGYGIAFWSAYSGLPTLAEQAYFGFAAPVPLLIGLLVALAVGGFLRPAPAALQLIGLVVALLWAVGLVVLFVLVEVLGGAGGELLDIVRGLSPGGIIFMLASLIVVIGGLTRLGRS